MLLRLRLGEPPVVARAEGDRVALDLRTVRDDEVEPTALAIAAAAVDPAAQAADLS